MIMKTNLRKMILWTIALLAISIMTTSSVNPGYDEFGNDINECLEDPCPEGYTCMNLPGSFLRSEERRVGKECRSRWSPYH